VVAEAEAIAQKGGHVKFIDFGSDEAYIIRWS